MSTVETDAPSRGSWPLYAIAGTGLAAVGAACLLLWARFGEGVYANAIVNAILSCF